MKSSRRSLSSERRGSATGSTGYIRIGVIRHGQDYSLAHTALSAWEQDANHVHRQVSTRHAKALAEVLSIRARLLKAEQLLEVLRQELTNDAAT